MEKTLEQPGQQKASIWSTGLAMFAMFFGAGNIVFPIALGQATQDKNFFAVSGLIVTAVLVPLMGLLAMLLYNGDYTSFFKRIGKVPGFILGAMILGLIGPFGALPRCITISFSTLNASGMGGVSLPVFSLISCAVIFLFTFKPNKILTLLGFVLTPILLVALGVIVAKGFFEMPYPGSSAQGAFETFSQGLFEGYNTMDLLATFFFSSVVLHCLRGNRSASEGPSKQMISVAFYGSIIAASLLAAVYLSFSFLAAGFSGELASVANHEMLGTLAFRLLGPYAGLIASVAVAFACLTTEIALTVVFAEFLHETVFRKKLSYHLTLIITLVLSFLVSTLDFSGISTFLVPILQMCYPALIVLCILNVLYKTHNFKPVKSIFYTTLGATVLLQLVG